jgi:hypothetical protein
MSMPMKMLGFTKRDALTQGKIRADDTPTLGFYFLKNLRVSGEGAPS